MSYNVEELFDFGKVNGGYAPLYRKKDDPTITELEIPEEYNGKSVVCITYFDFIQSNHLKSVKLPKSLKAISPAAFWHCPRPERVEFGSNPKIGLKAFRGCPKLPPETVAMGPVCSTDITRPILRTNIEQIMNDPLDLTGLLRSDVFELLIKNNCFRECDDLKPVFYGIINN